MIRSFPLRFLGAVAIFAAAASSVSFAGPYDVPMGGGCPFCDPGSYTPPVIDPTPIDSAKPAPSAAAPKPTAPAVATPAGPRPPPPEVRQDADGYWRVSFLNLASFDFAAPPASAPAEPGSQRNIPDAVRQLDGKRVALSGYMLPLKIADGHVKEFLLIRTPMMCCYGVMPAPNEWVLVRMKDPGVAALMDTPLNLYGTLRVGEVYENDVFSGIYRVEGERVSKP